MPRFRRRSIMSGVDHLTSRTFRSRSETQHERDVMPMIAFSMELANLPQLFWAGSSCVGRTSPAPLRSRRTLPSSLLRGESKWRFGVDRWPTESRKGFSLSIAQEVFVLQIHAAAPYLFSD